MDGVAKVGAEKKEGRTTYKKNRKHKENKKIIREWFSYQSSNELTI